MKSNVTVEELNAATILMTGISVSQLAELHISGSVVTAIAVDGEGGLRVVRVPIGELATSEAEAEEVDEDDGT